MIPIAFGSKEYLSAFALTQRIGRLAAEKAILSSRHEEVAEDYEELMPVRSAAGQHRFDDYFQDSTLDPLSKIKIHHVPL